MGYDTTEYRVFGIGAFTGSIVSLHVVLNEIIPNPTDEFFAELERLKINVALESRHPANYYFRVGMHIDHEDGLVYETTCATVHKGYIVACRRLVLQRTS